MIFSKKHLTLKKLIKYKLLTMKLLIAFGVIHPVKHHLHIHVEEYCKKKAPTYISRVF